MKSLTEPSDQLATSRGDYSQDTAAISFLLGQDSSLDQNQEEVLEEDCDAQNLNQAFVTSVLNQSLTCLPQFAKEKRVVFAKQIGRKSSENSIPILPNIGNAKLPSIERLDTFDFGTTHRSAVFKQKENAFESTKSIRYLSNYSIEQEDLLISQKRISQLTEQQKQKFLPCIKEQPNNEKEQFYAQYKINDKLKQFEKKYKSNRFQFKSISSKAEELKLLPLTFKMFNSTSDVKKELDLTNYGVGNQYSEVLSEALKVDHLQHLIKFKLAKNNLRGGSLGSIFKSFTPSIRALDISGNKIFADESSSTFKPLFARTTLSILNLENCKIGDLGFVELYMNIKDNKHLRVLNLNQNNLTNVSSQKLNTILTFNTSLYELYLRWNNFQNDGGVEVLKGIYENTYLKVIDFSYNSLKYHGNVTEYNKEKTAAYQVQRILQKESMDLLHFDLSYNMFSMKECDMIKLGLENNNWLYGFHFEGNQNYIVDQFGFLTELKESGGLRPKMHNTHQIKSIMEIRYPFTFSDDQQINSQKTDSCWICQNSQEICIKADDLLQEPLFIHFSHLDYVPILLSKDDNGIYEKLVVVPKNSEIKFFFSNPLESSKGIISTKYKIKQEQLSEQFNFKFNSENQKSIFILVHSMNIIQSQSQIMFDYQNHYRVKLQSCPRERKANYKIPDNEWDISSSIWKNFQADTEDNLKKCIEFDIQTSRIEKLVKDSDDLANLKGILLERYMILKEVYKIQAAIQPYGDIFCIGSQTFLRLMQKTKLLDSKIKLADVDRLFIATNFNPADQSADNNPLKALVRYEFIEMLVRLAHEKYPNVSFSEAFKQFYEEDIKEHFSIFPLSQIWRTEKYWNQEIEKEILNEMDLLKSMFDAQCLKNPACYQSQVKYVDLLTFISFITKAVGEKLIEKMAAATMEINLKTIFHVSLQNHIDEINSEEFQQMGLIEFIEAITRVGELLFNDGVIPLRCQLQQILFELCNEAEKQNILKRQEKEIQMIKDEENKAIRRILLNTRKDYNFKQSLSTKTLSKYSNLKLLSNQPRYIPSLHGDQEKQTHGNSYFDLKSKIF